ncbi:DUF4190 domain-containing protein [Nocardia sp. CNY236]|uniref:DUF4190 domain-containing protein n=1 Tax=Nocardia sp. CNY236 TaxID=1169152 RepID=UPI0003F5E5AF|nr:DUF4190 domain-containing protein [Nocardia sp. CNY236]
MNMPRYPEPTDDAQREPDPLSLSKHPEDSHAGQRTPPPAADASVPTLDGSADSSVQPPSTPFAPPPTSPVEQWQSTGYPHEQSLGPAAYPPVVPPPPGPQQPYLPDAQPQPYPAGGYWGYPPSEPQAQGNFPPPGPHSQHGYPSPGYPNYPGPGYHPYPPPQQSGKVYSIVGFVCAATALLFCPIVIGTAGIVLGVVGHTKGEPLGKWAAIAAGVGTVVGTVLGLWMYSDILGG